MIDTRWMAVLQGWVGGREREGCTCTERWEKNGTFFSLGAIESPGGRRDGYKGKEQLTRIDRGIFGWSTLDDCSITSYRTFYLGVPVDRAPNAVIIFVLRGIIREGRSGS